MQVTHSLDPKDLFARAVLEGNLLKGSLGTAGTMVTIHIHQSEHLIHHSGFLVLFLSLTSDKAASYGIVVAVLLDI